jgi:hypothetical protein
MPRSTTTLAALALAPLFATFAACATPRNDAAPPGTSRDAVVDTNPTSDPITADRDDRSQRRSDTDEGPVGPSYESPPLAVRPTPPRPVVRPEPVSPYRVELVDESSNRLPTYRHGGRTYVLGSIGRRYRVHISNPTSRRVEAVISIDGLDAVDGKSADYVNKSGYLVPAYGDLTIDGFRTSIENVATFRFSSVRDSYAGRKGSDRNVGVIGVAFFPEREAPRVTRRYDSYDGPSGSSASPPAKASEAPRAAPSPAATNGVGGAGSFEEGQAADRAASAAPAARGRTSEPVAEAKKERSGLGTEFGEQRESHVEYVDFRRADQAHPGVVAELRYNDHDGLVSLGIPLDPPRPSEVGLRETASPFPQNHFASPPPPRY